MHRKRMPPPAPATDWLVATEALSPAPARPPLVTVGAPVDPAHITPFEVTAYLTGAISLPHGPMALDSLIAAAVCMREGITPAMRSEDLRPVEIPIAREPAGRFHLASFSVGTFEHFGVRWVTRRFPIAEAQSLGDGRLRRINIAGGPCRNYRIPLEAGHLQHDRLRWFALGDVERVKALLSLISYLGKKRGVGLGRVLRWEVAAVPPWSGFPVVSPGGKPLRTLPVDWPGLVDAELGHRTLTFPYWRREAEELCAIATEATS